MANLLHRIKAYLYKNMFTDDPNDYMARVATERSLNVKEICQSAVQRGGADIPASTMQHAVELFLREMEHKLCDGYAVNTGSFIAAPFVKGVFNSPKETFNPAKHTLLFRFKQGDSLRKKLSATDVHILGVANSNYIKQVTDLKSGSANEWITPHHNIRISGRKLKLTGNDPEVGVYFINRNTEERIKVELSDIVTNLPSELIVMVPALETGSYRLEVMTQFVTHSTLKQPRTIVFEHELKVL